MPINVFANWPLALGKHLFGHKRKICRRIAALTSCFA